MTKVMSYVELNTIFRKGLRNGNWKKLKFMDKALYRAAMWYAKHGRSIVGGLVVEKLLEIIEKLKETKGMRIFKGGLKRATAMLRYEKKGVFVWAPQVKEWLKDPDYIFWLGMVSQGR